LLASPQADVLGSLRNELFNQSHQFDESFEPSLLSLSSVFADTVSVEKNLGLNLNEPVFALVVALSIVPGVHIERIIEHFHRVHG